MYLYPNEHHPELSSWSKQPQTWYFQLGIEVTRQLRGELSQREFSQKLGYTFNQVGKWESGTTQIKFSDFLKIVAAAGIPIEKKFNQYFYTFKGPFSEENCIPAILSILSLPEDEEHPATKKIREWQKNRPRPDFWEILEILDLRPSHLVAWLSELIDCRKIERIQSRYEAYLSGVTTIQSYPVAALIVAALNLEAYQELDSHDDQFLAQHSACTAQEVREILNHLLSAGFIIFIGKKYQPGPRHFGFSTINNAKLRGMTKFATDLASKRYSLTPAKIDPQGNVGQSSFRSMALSREGSLRVRDLILKFHADLAELEANDLEPKNNVQIILAHSFPSNINSDN